MQSDTAFPPREFPSLFQCALLAVTTARFRPDRDLSADLKRMFAELEREGWTFRNASVRNFLCWRNSALIKDSIARIAIFPNLEVPLTAVERKAVLLSELSYRLGRIRARDPNAAIGYEPAVKAMQQAVSEVVPADGDFQNRWSSILRQAEVKVLEAASGWPIGSPR